jgi:hypothetical protein
LASELPQDFVSVNEIAGFRLSDGFEKRGFLFRAQLNKLFLLIVAEGFVILNAFHRLGLQAYGT